MTTLYSLAEVSEQNGKDGAKTWIVIRDIVYDVTEYLDDVNWCSSTIEIKSVNLIRFDDFASAF